MYDDEMTMGPFIDYGHARIDYARCLGPACIVRWPSGNDRPCSAECERAWLAKSMREANAA